MLQKLRSWRAGAAARRAAKASFKDGFIDSGVLGGELLTDVLGGGLSSSGVSVTPEKALGVVTVFACIYWRSSMMGHLPFRLMREEGNSREVVRDHPLAVALDEPHEDINKVDFLSTMEACHALYNVAYAQVVRNRLGEVLGFVPLHPPRVEPRRLDERGNPDPCGRMHYFIDGGAHVLRREEVVHLKGLSLDGCNTVSFTRYAKECLGLAMALDKDAGLTFSEGVRFPGLLVTETEVGDKAYDRITSWLQRRDGNLMGRLKGMLLDAGVKPWEPARNYQQLEFAETRQRQQVAICQMLRVPPHKVGILENSIKANIEAQQIEAISDVLAPIAVKFEAEFKQRCLTPAEKRAGYYLKFNLNALLRGTMRDRAEFYQVLLRNRAMSPNEVRALEELNPYAGGEEFFGPMNEETVGETISRAGEAETEND